LEHYKQKKKGARGKRSKKGSVTSSEDANISPPPGVLLPSSVVRDISEYYNAEHASSPIAGMVPPGNFSSKTSDPPLNPFAKPWTPSGIMTGDSTPYATFTPALVVPPGLDDAPVDWGEARSRLFDLISQELVGKSPQSFDTMANAVGPVYV
jgi:hypothetical protein